MDAERIPLEEPRWYCCMTGPRQESTAATWLRRAGYHAVFPFNRFQVRQKRPHGRTLVAWVERPHFPRYVFVALRYVNEAIGPINSVKGVSKLVCRRLSGIPLQIPTRIMDALLEERIVMTEEGGVVMSETFLHEDKWHKDHELRVFCSGLGRWKCEVAA